MVTTDKFTDIMLDNETMGLGPNAAVVQIGAVPFNWRTGETGEGLQIDVDLNSALMLGGETHPDTIRWWRERGGFQASGPTKQMRSALKTLADFCSRFESLKRVWAKGLAFDVAQLEGYFARAGVECPWPYNVPQEMRTVVALAKDMGYEPEPTGEPAHTALADAEAQVGQLMEALNFLRSGGRSQPPMGDAA